MKQALANLQNQPHAVRTRVAVTVAAVVTGIIGLILLTTLPLRFAKVEGSADNTAAVIGATGDVAADQFSNMQDSWAALSGLRVTEASSAEAQTQTTVPGQDSSQDAAFQEDGASTFDNNY